MKPLQVAIVDYDIGNLFSVEQSCKNVGLETIITSDSKILLESDGLILPGVGAFSNAMEHLIKKDLVSPIHDFVQSGKPFFGVCLGMQLLFTESEEFGSCKGLDLISGRVVRFSQSLESKKVKVPQIGWNRINIPNGIDWNKTPLEGIQNGEYMYFVHSYYSIPEDSKNILCSTQYAGIEYCSGTAKNNIFAFQFHPEKSAIEGVKIYNNLKKIITDSATVYGRK